MNLTSNDQLTYFAQDWTDKDKPYKARLHKSIITNIEVKPVALILPSIRKWEIKTIEEKAKMRIIMLSIPCIPFLH